MNKLVNWMRNRMGGSQKGSMRLVPTILSDEYRRSAIMEYHGGSMPPCKPPKPPAKRIINEDVKLPFSRAIPTSGIYSNGETTITLPSEPSEGQVVSVLVGDDPVCVKASNTIGKLPWDRWLNVGGKEIRFIFDGKTWQALSIIDGGVSRRDILKDLTDDNEIECYIDRIGL